MLLVFTLTMLLLLLLITINKRGDSATSALRNSLEPTGPPQHQHQHHFLANTLSALSASGESDGSENRSILCVIIIVICIIIIIMNHPFNHRLYYNLCTGDILVRQYSGRHWQWYYIGTVIFWDAFAMILHWQWYCICNGVALAMVLQRRRWQSPTASHLVKISGISVQLQDRQMAAVITDISLNVNCQLSSRKSQQLNISARSKCNCKICGLHNCFKMSCKKLSAQEYSILMHNMQWPSNSGRSQRKPLRSSTLPTPSL